MDLTPNYSLIPYPGHDYQLKAYVPENQDRGQNFEPAPIAVHHPFGQSRSNFSFINLETPIHLYDARKNLVYPPIDPVGHLVDIYA